MITDSDYYKIKLFQKFEPQIRQARILSSLSKPNQACYLWKKLALISLGDMPFGAVIESAEVVDLVKMMFLFIWQSLPEERLVKEVKMLKCSSINKRVYKNKSSPPR